MAAHKKRKTSSKRTPKKKTARKAVRKVAKRVARKPARKSRASDSLAAEQARLARNKKLVVDFYQTLIGEKDATGARKYMGDVYKQHSPYATDGHDGVAEFVRTMKAQFPRHHYRVNRVIAEGDFVVLHLHGQEGLYPHGEAVIDIFRVENGKVVEHWDVIQELAPASEWKNRNTPF